ncbi:MAG: YdcF family protein [Gammaproteobacteria bacterium]|nr:YdcF family protein [Gammaproteobacteria bacterium]MCH9716193.1 YdcF family protein [Gammaproteobacteria bacterium]MCH9763929.1 YdcF family protein [Gammaproteobacteria bacterium]
MTYGTLAAACRNFFEYLLNPFAWFFLILLACIAYLLWPGRECTTKWLGFVCAFLWVGLYLTSTPWLPDWMIARLESEYSYVKQVDAAVPWVVVLGGGVAENLSLPAAEVLSGPSVKRVLEGVRLYRQLPHAKLIVSGGGSKHVAYAEAMRQASFTDWLGVPQANTVLETDSINTADEARFIQPMIGSAPFYLVTSALHMPRAMRLFEKQNMHPIAAPCQYLFIPSEVKKPWRRVLPTASNLMRFNVAWHEYLGRFWGFLRRKV